ncbi:hypothetical protein OAI67_03265 [Candidatus Nitrosopelagicus sp.]|nr:hypothetical protein [Candidatus Nitrosopelagicus sp.]
MKKILYYVSEHGLGHLTRSIALIRELQNEVEIIIRNSNESVLKKSIPKISTFSGKTDQGPIISENSVSIDWKKTFTFVNDWYSNFNSNVQKEYDFIKKLEPDVVISDISPIPLSASKKLNIQSIAISNFTWLDIFSKLENFNLQLIQESYENTSFCIQLPLSTKMDVFKQKKKVGFVCKLPTEDKTLIRKKLNIDKSKFLILINLPKFFNVTLKNFKNFQVISTGAKTSFENTIFIEPFIEGQNLINASDLVVSKCGYGMISECLTNGIPFKLISDESHPEQNAMIEHLSRYDINNRILDWQKGQIEIDFNDIQYFESFENDNSNAKHIVQEFLK